MTFMSSRLNQPYVHGSKPQEQRRLSNLNKVLNQACLREQALKRGEVILDVGSGFDPHMARFDRTLNI